MKKIEEKYKVLNHIDHILLRPQTYLGSNKPHTQIKWIHIDNKMIKKEVTYVPSFLKIFDELITNSVDESKRNSKLNKIEVNVDKKSGIISVRDNGGIPVVIHKEHGKYVSEVIFGNLMSGSNYDDNESRTGAGTNGYGAKLTNVFSKQFIISTCDGKKHFTQTFTNNMRERNVPVVKNSKINFTQISYLPDYEKFGLNGIDDDHLLLIKKRVIDIAGCNSNLGIYFNGEIIDIKNFEDYMNLYKESPIYQTNKENTWSFGITNSEEGFQQVSFVNSTDTYDGGTHLDFITNQIISKIRDFIKKKWKTDIKPSEIKNHIFIFLNSTIVNPAFSSQTKEKLITEVKDFGFDFEISDKTMNLILKSDIISSISDWLEKKKVADDNKLTRQLNKQISNVKVDKLIDAKGKDRWKCSLGIYEGDCLEENTLVRVLREGELLDVRIKNINIGDLVITHNNKFQEVSALTKNIQYKNIVKTSIGNIECSNKHRFFVYDIDKNEFLFEHLYNLDKNKHKLVKNQLCFMDALLEIDEISDNILKMKSGESFEVSIDHRLCVYNRDLDKFEMEYLENITDISKYLIVNTFTI
jgi:DNA topoisomerase II